MAHKGIKWSKEAIENRAKALRGKKRTPEQCKRIGNARRGKVLSKEEIQKRTETRRKNGWNKNPERTKKLQSDNNARARLGVKESEETRMKKSLSAPKGEDNIQWKGDNVGYDALHDWVVRQLGKPNKCENCKKKRRCTWANIGHTYKRNLEDWIRLCYSCHKLYDLGKIEIDVHKIKKTLV
jgi:hypothetical protein